MSAFKMLTTRPLFTANYAILSNVQNIATYLRNNCDQLQNSTKLVTKVKVPNTEFFECHAVFTAAEEFQVPVG